MSSQRHIYLEMKSLEEARRILFDAFTHSTGTEEIGVVQSVGRALSKPIWARFSSPNFHASAMDGIAVIAEKTFAASESSPVELVVGRDAFFVNTGHVIPEPMNAVIKIEDVSVSDNEENVVIIEAPAFPWQYVRRMGEDIVATELLFPRNHVVTPYCIGALISGGIFSVHVKKKPKILMIPTGSEIVDWRNLEPANIEQALKPGQVLESNTYVLGALIEALGASPLRRGLLKDDLVSISRAVSEEASSQSDVDVILLVGGSSAGSEDYSRQVISDLGEILVHGVTMMPGKPLIIGKVNGKPVFGVPGYPVSAIMAFEEFIKPLICKMLEIPDIRPQKITVETTRKIASKLGVEEFLRVKLGKVGERIVATTLPRGAGNITSLTEADGIIRIPAHIEGINESQPVDARLLRPLERIENTVVVVGSHDNTIDVLADMLKIRHGDFSISSTHVGSMGGIMAIKKNACHVAGSHLLDAEDGSYNISYIRRYLSGIPVKLVNLVFRDQGLIVLKNNPKNIRGIEDLNREDVSFINRQGGSGTRILLDYRLRELGIDPALIHGYENEEYTHMAVAAAVLSGTADAGLGIFAAAAALGLDFIPVVTEQYDLIIPEMYFDTSKIQALLETVQSPGFKDRVESLGGYSTKKTGEILF